jgi:hypothetical protein
MLTEKNWNGLNLFLFSIIKPQKRIDSSLRNENKQCGGITLNKSNAAAINYSVITD